MSRKSKCHTTQPLAILRFFPRNCCKKQHTKKSNEIKVKKTSILLKKEIKRLFLFILLIYFGCMPFSQRVRRSYTFEIKNTGYKLHGKLCYREWAVLFLLKTFSLVNVTIVVVVWSDCFFLFIWLVWSGILINMSNNWRENCSTCDWTQWYHCSRLHLQNTHKCTLWVEMIHRKTIFIAEMFESFKMITTRESLNGRYEINVCVCWTTRSFICHQKKLAIFIVVI